MGAPPGRSKAKPTLRTLHGGSVLRGNLTAGTRQAPLRPMPPR
jgi:hypothetical protein